MGMLGVVGLGPQRDQLESFLSCKTVEGLVQETTIISANLSISSETICPVMLCV